MQQQSREGEQKLTDVVLRLKNLVASERKITAEIIETIQEIDRAKSFLQLGYSNLYTFLTEYIGYTPASAQRRIDAARLLTSVPEVKADVKSGSLNLSQVSLVAQAIRQKQKESPSVQMMAADKKSLLESIKGQSLEVSQRTVCQTLDLEIKQADKKRIQQDESVRLELTLSKTQMEMLNRVKSLMSHVNPNPSMSEIFAYMAVEFLKRKDPARKVRSQVREVEEPAQHTGKGTSAVTSATEVKMSSSAVGRHSRRLHRYIPAAIKRIVWQRDGGKCQYVHKPTGRKCESTHLLELDHIKRFRHGGDHNSENLRLLCDAHNRQRG